MHQGWFLGVGMEEWGKEVIVSHKKKSESEGSVVLYARTFHAMSQ